MLATVAVPPRFMDQRVGKSMSQHNMAPRIQADSVKCHDLHNARRPTRTLEEWHKSVYVSVEEDGERSKFDARIAFNKA